MYKVLIVDDEATICKGLRVLIDWNKYGFEIAGEASNGLEALEQAESLRYDVIVTDIRMPEVDGLELIRRLKATKYSARIIILSGYKDFEYARAAIEYGVKNYVLKPIDEDVLISSLNDIRIEIEEELRNSTTIRESKSIVRDKVLEYIVKNGIRNNFTLKKTIETGVVLTADYFQICIIEAIDNNGEEVGSRTLISKNTAEEIIYKYSSGYVFELEEDKIGVLLCLSEQNSNQTNILVGEIFECLSKDTNSSITIAVGNKVLDYRDIPASYKNAEKALELKIFDGRSSIIYFDNISVLNQQDNIVNAENNRSNRTIEEIEKFVKEHYHEELSLVKLSKKYFMSPVYLGRLFKNTTGESFTDYVNQCRICSATKLLESDELMVCEISEKVGYKDINYFYKIFKGKKGITPSEYRMSYNEATASLKRR